MTTEEKARAYNEILAKAKEFKLQGYIDEECLYDMFPQLRESEDEEDSGRTANAGMPAYNFSAITVKYDVIAKYRNHPVLPQKGDLMLIDGHPMKIVRWVHDNKEGNSGFAVMVVRDLDLEPYTRQEVRQRLEAGETFWIRTGVGMKLRRYKGDKPKHPKWLDFDPETGATQVWDVEEGEVERYVERIVNGMYTFSVDDESHLKNSNQ